MFLPERMLSVEILALNEDAFKVAQALAAEGSLHIVSSKAIDIEIDGGDAIESGQMLAECDRIGSRTQGLLGQLNAEPRKIGQARLHELLAEDTADLLEGAKTEVEKLRGEIGDAYEERERIETQIAELDSISEIMHLFEENDLSFDTVAEFHHLYAAYGIARPRARKILSERLEGRICGIISRPHGKRGEVVMLIGDKDESQTFENALKSVDFRPQVIPERFLESVDEGLDLVEMELWQLRDELVDVNRAIAANRKKWIGTLSDWREGLRVHSLVLRETSKFGNAGIARVINGYLPESEQRNLIERLEGEVSGRYYAETWPAEPGREATVPTRLKNSAFFKPFELFTKTYGLPRYNDIDPTPIVGITFILMFGMMFPDVGHGLVFAAFGAFLAFTRRALPAVVRSLGRIFMMTGTSAIVFGFLFGTVFGVENDHVLPALWMRPMEPQNLIVLLAVSAGIGICIVSLGIVLNIVQSFRKRNLEEVFFGEWSFASLGFYWAILALLLLRPNMHFSVFTLIALLLPLALMVVVPFTKYLLQRDRLDADGTPDLAALFFAPLEVVMNLFSNTVSFLRVAAFGLAHGALTMAVFIVNDMVSVPGAKLISFPIEHLLIIVFEGMIVTIQCLRLEYYEFFLKFFEAGGIEYAPLSIESEGDS